MRSASSRVVLPWTIFTTQFRRSTRVVSPFVAFSPFSSPQSQSQTWRTLHPEQPEHSRTRHMKPKTTEPKTRAPTLRSYHICRFNVSFRPMLNTRRKRTQKLARMPRSSPARAPEVIRNPKLDILESHTNDGRREETAQKNKMSSRVTRRH